MYFDHMFTKDQQHRFLKRLEKLGFTLQPQTVEHPGRHFCRFIMFQRPKFKTRKVVYLEFVNTKPGGKVFYNPGISFGYAKDLIQVHTRMKRAGRYRSKYVHKNFEWKKDSKSRLPGWNFVTFPGLNMRGLYPWLTEYEAWSKRKTPLTTKHKNGVYKLVALELQVNAKAEAFLSHLWQRKLGDVVKLDCGTEFYITRGKRTRVNAVVLKTKNFKKMIARYKMDDVSTYRGKPSARIQNPSGMWDIVII